ncbi:MAG: glycoside hydrolase family 127 protein [Alistipes sp.]|nr:glycoside hydrolase family 127 protein [Alistipes sp.]
MKARKIQAKHIFSTIALSAVFFATCKSERVEREQESLTPVTFEKVALEDDFWLPRLKIQKQTLVPFSLQKTENAVENLRRVGEWVQKGKGQKLLNLPRYVASDLFKVMEGAASLLAVERDAELEAQMDEIIDIIAASQCEDGYLYELFSVPQDMHHHHGWGAGDGRYTFVVHSHELYDVGHMYEGAVAYYRATGKRKWLDVAEKNAQHINKVFFEGDPNYNGGKPIMQAPGHQEIELALIKLSQATGNKLYAEMAKKFIDVRGVTYCPQGEGVMAPSYAQQHLPVREQRTAEGHSVRAMYLYSGMADVVAEFGDTTLNPALDAIWHDIMDKKIHINGGLGAVPGIEGFGPEYLLPNKDTYDETCAAVGNVFFNYRMFLASGDAKYVDAAEVSLYNNVLAGVNLEGNKFFYVNVLEADGKKAFNHGRAGRSPWFGTACCPSNMARLIPQVSGMIYSHTDDDIYCALYAGSSTVVPLASGDVTLKQQTEYPFEGNVAIEVEPAEEGQEFTMWLRIPTWCGDQFIPGELYTYADNNRSKVVATVNGEKVRAEVVDGYMPVKRAWKAGDKVELTMPMPLRYSVADERVEADVNRVCLTRGPLVYCAEQPDNEHPASNYIVKKIGKQGEVSAFAEGIMNGISYITLPAEALVGEQSEGATLTLIPYYAWNNRGDNTTMNVWFARSAQTVLDAIPHTVGNIKSVKASHTFASDSELAIADGKEPQHSNDNSIPRWTSYSEFGKAQWVELELKKEQPVESVSVYWYDDKGGVQLPVSWSLEYRVGGEWKAWQLYNTDNYNLFADQYNMVHPAEPIKADAIRINVQPKANSTAGILEVVVE